jgi:hypothetical protein
MEDILSSCVHTAPFYGVSICPYCADRVDVLSMSSWLEHFSTIHRRLWGSIFSCPTCVGIRIFTWSSYLKHFEENHAKTLGFLVVLDETNTSARHGCGLALFAMCKMVELWKYDPVDPGAVAREPAEMVTVYGGYKPATADLKELAQEIRAKQMASLPGDWRTPKERQEEEAAARKRGAQGQNTSRAAKQKPASRLIEDWRDPTPNIRSAASSRAGSPAPTQTWSEMMQSEERAAAMPSGSAGSVYQSPGVPGLDWESTAPEIDNILRLASGDEDGNNNSMDADGDEAM